MVSVRNGGRPGSLFHRAFDFLSSKVAIKQIRKPRHLVDRLTTRWDVKVFVETFTNPQCTERAQALSIFDSLIEFNFEQKSVVKVIGEINGLRI